MTDDPVIRLTPVANEPARRRPLALGRGLGALLGDVRREEASNGAAAPTGDMNGLATLAVAAIEPHPDQPRRRFDDAALDELAASIAQRGMIQPIIVRPLAEGRYQIVAGERRWRAAQRARLHEIPALVRELDDGEVTALALIENLQREDLNPIEEARAYYRLTREQGLSQADIARMVDKSRSYVTNIVRLLTLPESVIALVESGQLSMGHARALIGVENAAAIAEEAVARGLSVREVEQRARRDARGEAPSRAPARSAKGGDDDDLASVQHNLEALLGLPVRIETQGKASVGTVIVEYATLDQLDLVCQRLAGRSI